MPAKNNLPKLVQKLKDLVSELDDSNEKGKNVKNKQKYPYQPCQVPFNINGDANYPQLPCPPCTCPYFYMWCQSQPFGSMMQYQQQLPQQTLKQVMKQQSGDGEDDDDEDDDDSEEENEDDDPEDGGNFYNNYNVDWHHKTKEEKWIDHAQYLAEKIKAVAGLDEGVTLDGQTPADPKCVKKRKQDLKQMVEGVRVPLLCHPSNISPYMFTMTPPAGGDVSTPWIGDLQPCNHRKSSSISNGLSYK